MLPALDEVEPEDELDDEDDCDPWRLDGMLAVLPGLELLALGIDGIDDELEDCDPGIDGIEAVLELDEELDDELDELDEEELCRDEDDELLGIEGELDCDPDEEEVGIDGIDELDELCCCCSSQPASNRPSVIASANGRHGREPEVRGAGMAAVSLFAADIGDQYTDTYKVWFRKTDPVGYAVPSARSGQHPADEPCRHRRPGLRQHRLRLSGRPLTRTELLPPSRRGPIPTRTGRG